MTLLTRNLKLAALPWIGCFMLAVPPVFSQDPPQQAQPAPGAQGQGMRSPRPARAFRGAAMAMRRPGMVRRDVLARLLRDPELQKQLNLTDEQRKKLQDINFNTEKAAITERAAMQVQRLELKRLMRAENPDRAAIDKKIQEISQARTALMKTRANELLDVRAVLTKEQRDKIRETIQRRPRPMRQQGMNGPGMMRRGMNPPPGQRQN